jgi:RND family efflux transporter MFP subunit
MLESIVGTWLSYQCQMIPRVQRGFVALGASASGGISPTAAWPDAGSATDSMANAARLAAERGATVVRSADGPAQGELLDVACPLVVDGRAVGVVALEIATSSEQQRAVTQLLQWGVSWLQVLVGCETSAFARRMLTLLEVLNAGVEESGLDAAAAATANKLARLLDCTRICVGFGSRKGIRVRAVSGAGRPRRRAELVRHVEAAMDEAVDQGQTVAHPPPESASPRSAAAARRLASLPGSGSVCTVPVASLGRSIGAITLERPPDAPFDVPTVELCEALAALLGPVFELKRRDEQPLVARLQAAIGGGARPTRRWLAPTAVAVLALLVVALGTLTVPHRVTARARIESAETRALVAPQSGFIAAAPHRAGATVRAGELLASLDREALMLEAVKLGAERDQLAKEHRSALVEGDRARTRILLARVEQTEAALALTRSQLERARIEAPFDGVIVSGDLSHSLGAPVEKGAVLFEVAPAGDHRAVLQVDERDVSLVASGQHANLVLAAAPAAPLLIRITLLTPVSTPVDGRNVFRVEAAIQSPRDGLRPGMEGVAKIEVGEGSIARVWGGRLADRLRLLAWTWLP